MCSKRANYIWYFLGVTKCDSCDKTERHTRGAVGCIAVQFCFMSAVNGCARLVLGTEWICRRCLVADPLCYYVGNPLYSILQNESLITVIASHFTDMWLFPWFVLGYFYLCSWVPFTMREGMWPKWKLWAIPGATALTPLKSHGINLAPLEMPQPVSCHTFTKCSSDISGIEEVWLTWILAVPHDQVKPWGAVKVMLHKSIA